jgi:hypothetical protein
MITTHPVKGEQSYIVLRAICMDGQRVEPGQTVTLSAQLAVELAAAGKVSAQPVVADAVDPALGPQTRTRKPRGVEA